MNIENIRNFVIISHIDHGKSTLADRFLELTKTIEPRKMQEQVLDTMDLERERGITIKMAPVQMHYTLDTKPYILNLIDTPGHVDFSYEVSRALAAVEGAILLVDGTKGIQAQTLAHFNEAQKQGLVILPVINKIDLASSEVERVAEEIKTILPGKEIFKISAKKGTGIDILLQEVIKQVPPPSQDSEPYPRALIFDSRYDSYKGVLAYVRVMGGTFSARDNIRFLAQKKETEIMEVGVFKPQLEAREVINEGSIGYIATGLKEPGMVRVGDTIVSISNSQFPISNAKPLVGYDEPKPVVFASVFPTDGAQLKFLEDAFSKLKLSDWALVYEPDSSIVLGRGYRCGFLGSLHLDIILERLRREFNLSFIATSPSVNYEVVTHSNQTQNIYNSSEFPNAGEIKEVREPWVRISVFVPNEYLGGIMKLIQGRRGVYIDTEYLGSERVELIYEIPLSEIISDFYDKLKSVSSGFASLSYEFIGWRRGELVKLDILVAGDAIEAFSKIVPKGRSYEEGKKLVSRLKELLPRQLFKVSLQAKVEGRIISRQDLPALKKNVTGHLYGGDITRKKKLWAKQKRGKKKLQKIGRVNIPNRVFVEMLKE